tara:strand:+ start:1377 stop:1595 length:219 start_codon:yes stop_codon:yes gene_type:complete
MLPIKNPMDLSLFLYNTGGSFKNKNDLLIPFHNIHIIIANPNVIQNTGYVSTIIPNEIAGFCKSLNDEKSIL